MGKGTNFSGQPVLSQLIKLMDRQNINTLASKTGSDRYVKYLDGYSHLVVMLYAVLCNLRSLREVCLGFEANATRMNHFGLDHMICRSTLSDANRRRSSSFFGRIYRSLFRKYAPVLSDSRTKHETATKIYIMDSTTITLFSEILKGAGRNSENGKKKGGIKAHTIIQEDIDLPIFVDFTAAATSDHELMKRIFSLPEGSFITFDMGYNDYLIWKQLTEKGYKFVTRQKDNARFEIIEKRSCPEKDIIADQIIELSSNKLVERPMTEEELSHRRGRRPKSGIVTVREYVKGKYRCRRIVRRSDDGKDTKQNFPLKYFLGDNVNAIEVQIWVTMIAYLLLRVMQHKAKCKLAFSNIVTLARLTIGNYVNFVTLLNCPKQAWAERLRYWNSLETAQNTVQLELQFSP